MKIIFVILLLLFVTGIQEPLQANAQEAGQAVTSDVPVEYVNADIAYQTVNLLAGGLIIVTGFFLFLRERDLAKFQNTFKTALENQVNIENARQRYIESSLPVKDVILLIRNTAHFLANMNLVGVDGFLDPLDEFLEDVTSDKPDVDNTGE